MQPTIHCWLLLNVMFGPQCRYHNVVVGAIGISKVLDQHTTYRGTAIPFLARVDCKIKISNANFTSEIRKTIVLGIF
jgi:hypothetical protein